MKRLGAFAIFILIAAVQIPVFAAPVSEIAFLARCYAHLTGRPLPIAHTLRTQVETGKITATAACEQILDKAYLGANGYLTSTGDMEARAVLQNFNNFHRSWFPGNIVEGIQEYGLETSRGTQDIYDSTEPGLAVTRALFAQDGRYSEVLTLPTGVHALREEDAAVKARIGWNVNFPGRRIFGNNGPLDLNLFHFSPLTGGFNTNSDVSTAFFMNLPKIEVGELVGVRRTTESVTIPNVNLFPLGGYVTGNSIPALNFTFDLYKTMGGGVLGTPIYIMLNYGHGRGLMANGTTKVPRRWSQTNMTSFLCANLPALRESDITQFFVGTSSAPFRNSNSCLRCHANLDPMAYTVRNVITAGTDFTEFSEGSRTHAKAAMVMTTFNADAGASSGWPSEPVANFHRMAPTGKLFFRSFATGELVNKSVNNVAELGAAMADTGDYYQCAAKRYFAFFTGINVSLYDKHDPDNAALNRALNEKDVKDRAFIETLATELRQTQSLRGMIKKIISSDYYKSVDYRP
ncbi:hypothetical protein [Bdellovibrio sp. HCB337]|uniref:hypothetical protein n=1 Tax=Bdellovibrio sp. HCB337 TaxID=3394358 RepID=UPI0039A6062C